MPKYEIMFIVKATIAAEEVKKTVTEMKNLIDSKQILEFKEMGEKKLAYPIKEETNGYYYVMQVTTQPKVIAEFDRKAAINENVLRHLIIRINEE